MNMGSVGGEKLVITVKQRIKIKKKAKLVLISTLQHISEYHKISSVCFSMFQINRDYK